jgi:hypothetical protein
MRLMKDERNKRREKRILAIILAVLIIFSSSLLKGYAFNQLNRGCKHNDDCVLMERQLQDIRILPCNISPNCTVTKYYYSELYKCKYCSYSYLLNTIEWSHSGH